MLEKKEMIYEGKAKRIYSTSKDQLLITEFKDSLTAFNAKKKGSFEGKGKINLKFTEIVFKLLEKAGVSTHFVEKLSDNLMAVKKLKIIPLEVVVRNRAAGSFATRFGIPEGEVLSKPLVEFYLKNDSLNDPLLTEEHILTLKIASHSEISKLKSKALEINRVLRIFFADVDITLIDFKLEFGKNSDGEIILGDEISPDSCRLWDSHTGERLDKDRFRRDLGRVEESYRTVLEKIEKKWKEL